MDSPRRVRSVKRRSVIHSDETWHEAVLSAVLYLLEEESDGTTCISTPDGRACEVTVNFTEAGRA